MTTQDAVPDLSDANLDEIVDCFDDYEPWQRQAKKCIAALRARSEKQNKVIEAAKAVDAASEEGEFYNPLRSALENLSAALADLERT